MRRHVRLLLPLLLVISPTAQGGLILSDSTFSNADWSHVAAIADLGGNFSTAQVGSGGNPGMYQGGSHNMPVAGSFIYAAHIFTSGGTYSPSTQGAIASISVAYDFVVNSVFNAGPAVGHGLLLEQAGVYYQYRFTDALQPNGWTHFSATGLLASDFQRVGTSGTQVTVPGTPDFGSTGAAIRFGYLTLNGIPLTGSGPSSTTWGIDNWSVTVTTVPEPSTLVLAGVGFLGLLRLQRMRRSGRTWG